MSNNELNHFDKKGNAVMVDVSEKDITHRKAVACGEILVCKEIFTKIIEGSIKKGDVLGVARIGGIMGSKQTSSLIPLCHPITIDKCAIEFETEQTDNGGIIRAICSVISDGRTGVEMEALTGVSSALLTIYDMCKAVDKGMIIQNIHLIEKSGGKSGDFNFNA